MARSNGDPEGKGQAMRDRIAASQREHRRRNRGDAAQADWSTADAGLLLAVISGVSSGGGAIQFGLTKDGGSYVIRIIGDGEPFNEYVRPTEDINLYLTGLSQDYEKGWRNK